MITLQIINDFDNSIKLSNNLIETIISDIIHRESKYTKINMSIIIVNDEPLKALEVATCALVASGTATLQAAIMNTPAIVIYKMNVLSWWLTKQLVQVNFASMANIIANELVFPELLQGADLFLKVSRDDLYSYDILHMLSNYFLEKKHNIHPNHPQMFRSLIR